MGHVRLFHRVGAELVVGVFGAEGGGGQQQEGEAREASRHEIGPFEAGWRESRRAVQGRNVTRPGGVGKDLFQTAHAPEPARLRMRRPPACDSATPPSIRLHVPLTPALRIRTWEGPLCERARVVPQLLFRLGAPGQQEHVQRDATHFVGKRADATSCGVTSGVTMKRLPELPVRFIRPYSRRPVASAAADLEHQAVGVVHR